jgi:hypothetical protein
VGRAPHLGRVPGGDLVTFVLTGLVLGLLVGAGISAAT